MKKNIVPIVAFLLAVLSAETARANLKVDFNSKNQGGGPTNEVGYQSYDAGHEVAADFITQSYSVVFPKTGPATVSLTPAWPNTTDNRVQQMIDRAAGYDTNWVGSNLALLTDFIGIDSRTGSGGNGNWDRVTGTPTYMTLTFGGLPAGTYKWTSYHHDTEHLWADFQVEFSTDGGDNYGAPILAQMTDSSVGGNPASPVTYTGDPDPDPLDLPSTLVTFFTADGVNSVVVRFAPFQDGVDPVAVHKQLFGLNAIEVIQDVPETSLRVDFNSKNQGGGPTNEVGYQSYDAGHEVAVDFITRNYRVVFPKTGPATVSLTPAWPNTTDNRVQQMIDRVAGYDANWVGNKLALLTDFIGIDSRTGSGGNGDWDRVTGTPTYMTLTFGGLPAGTYKWTSYHHDTEHLWADFQVEFSTDGGNNYGAPILAQMTDSSVGGNPASPVTYTGDPDPNPLNLPSTLVTSFTADGVNSVVVRFAPFQDGVDPVAVHKQFFGLNAIDVDQDVDQHGTLLVIR